MIGPATPAELDAVVALIAAEQARPERNITYLGTQIDGIRLELDGLAVEWTAALRVARDEDGTVVGASYADWDAETGRAWVHGPWVAGDDAAWARWARPLVDAVLAVLAELPADIRDFEVCGETVNTRLAGLAADLGWPATEINHAYRLTGERAATWPASSFAGEVRDLVADDVAGIRPLHDAEFPATYLPAERIASEAASGERMAIVATIDGTVAGYATGTVTPDGDGYIDFVAVHESARGTGAGIALVTGLSRRLLAAAPNDCVNLTVQDHRAPARSLYERLGFAIDASFVGYRLRP